MDLFSVGLVDFICGFWIVCCLVFSVLVFSGFGLYGLCLIEVVRVALLGLGLGISGLLWVLFGFVWLEFVVFTLLWWMLIVV